jgi:hypothetical protein
METAHQVPAACASPLRPLLMLLLLLLPQVLAAFPLAS